MEQKDEIIMNLGLDRDYNSFDREEVFSRTRMLLGEEAMDRLYNARVAVFGVGGVGGYTVEALVRSGVGNIELIDSDRVSMSNINRQIIATLDTVGRYKTEVMKERILSINPKANVKIRNVFFLPENSQEFDFMQYDYVVDAVDTVTAKLLIIMKCDEAKVPVISSMGAGNKLNPAMFEVADIYKTSVCPLAKVMRQELKKRGIKKLKVVYSKEVPVKPLEVDEKTKDKDAKTCADVAFQNKAKKMAPASISFVPSVVGLIIASEVVKDIALNN